MRNSGLETSELRAIGTCRRSVLVADLGERQPDQEEIVTRSARWTAGLAPDGSFYSGCSGFARSQGISVDNLQVLTTARGEYLV